MSTTEDYIRRMTEMQSKRVVDANGIEMKPGVKFVDPFDRSVVHKVVRVIPGHDSVVTDNGEEWIGIRRTKLKIVNSALNAKFKVGDKVKVIESCPWKGKTGTVVDYSDITGWYNIESRNISGGKCFSAFRESDLVAANSALNAKTIDEWAFEIMLRSKVGDMGKGAEDYMRKNRSVITKDVGAEGFRKLCSKFGNTLAYNAIATTNAVVRNALAWRARNAKDADGKELKVGDKIKVRVDMHGGWDGGGVITALKPYHVVEYKDVFGHINTTQENSVRKA